MSLNKSRDETTTFFLILATPPVLLLVGLCIQLNQYLLLTNLDANQVSADLLFVSNNCLTTYSNCQLSDTYILTCLSKQLTSDLLLSNWLVYLSYLRLTINSAKHSSKVVITNQQPHSPFVEDNCNLPTWAVSLSWFFTRISSAVHKFLKEQSEVKQWRRQDRVRWELEDRRQDSIG